MTDQKQINALKAQVNCLRYVLASVPLKTVPPSVAHLISGVLTLTSEQCLDEVKGKAIEDYKEDRAELIS